MGDLLPKASRSSSLKIACFLLSLRWVSAFVGEIGEVSLGEGLSAAVSLEGNSSFSVSVSSDGSPATSKAGLDVAKSNLAVVGVVCFGEEEVDEIEGVWRGLS